MQLEKPIQDTEPERPKRRFRRLRLAVRWLLVFYVVLLLLIFFGRVIDLIIVFPNHQRIDPQGAGQRLLEADGGTIEVWTARSPGAKRQEPEAFVLRFVGQGDRADRWAAATARLWAERPVEVWAMNYPGSGGSSGWPRLDRLCPSALHVYDALQQVAAGRPIFAHANSLGTTVALCLATQRPLAGLVLHNPAPLKQVILGRHGWWNLWLLAGPAATQIPDELDPVANAARIQVPAIFIHSEKDTTIPPSYQQLVVEAYQGPKREITVPGARHNDPLMPEAQREVSREIEWLWQAARQR